MIYKMAAAAAISQNFCTRFYLRYIDAARYLSMSTKVHRNQVMKGQLTALH
jgi:hypothetical protein